jgi:quercetin dioxygenase-like cupin family protein
MALEHAAPGEVVNLKAYAAKAPTRSAALTKNAAFETILMHVEAGKSHPPHRVDGPIIVHCLEGAVDFPVEDEPRTLRAGDWMFLPPAALHAVHAQENAQLLVTILFATEI